MGGFLPFEKRKRSPAENPVSVVPVVKDAAPPSPVRFPFAFRTVAKDIRPMVAPLHMNPATRGKSRLLTVSLPAFKNFTYKPLDKAFCVCYTTSVRLADAN